MTSTTDDPFDRAVVREQQMRSDRERVEWALRTSHVGTLQVLAMLVIPLPLHLWLVGWDRTITVLIHAAAITAWATIVVITWLGQRPGLPPQR